jgi:LAGLIDADG endonuclease
VFVWTHLESGADGGFVAGLIAGDGHFFIRPNNGDTSWLCGIALGLRADDTPLLARICRWSGVGRLSAVPAQANSRPQTCWTVQSQADCLRMVSILDKHPLFGKKAGEYDIWRAAVIAWTGSRDDRHARVADCRSRLAAHRSPDFVPDCSRVSIIDEHLLAFLAGFVTAEAHFGATPDGHPFFRVNLRSDDRQLLRFLRDWLAVGRLVDVPAYRSSRAAVSWRIGRLAELRNLTGYLDRHPPRGRVLRIYEAWRELVLLRDRRNGTRLDLAARVRERREYKSGMGTIVATNRLAERQARYLIVLRRWARAGPGPRTATAYETWRRSSARSAPTRDTIAATFGSWIGAVEAAGLNTDGCRTPAMNRRSQAAALEARAERMAATRAAVLAAVRDCAASLGKPPGVTEFLRWRADAAPGIPSHATIYRAFPRGWQSVLEAASTDTG